MTYDPMTDMRVFMQAVEQATPDHLTLDGYNSEAVPWRVTVRLEEDGCTINKIRQEVEIGLRGCRFGADVKIPEDAP